MLKAKSQFISKTDAKKEGFIFSVPAVVDAIGISSLATVVSAIANSANKKKKSGNEKIIIKQCKRKLL